jgi:sterol desaturase/sphingolipid hydroxylase (fatty acid hydroxylase superfamily)
MSTLWQVEPWLRLGAFVGVLLLLALWEALAPRRRWQVNRPGRWLNNLGLALLNSLVLRLVAPLGLVGVAFWAEQRGWGLCSWLPLPPLLAHLLAFLALDLIVYGQHVLFHAVPFLWRLHLVHHADLDFDVTTGVRFHTLEMLLSLGIKAAAVILLGAPPLAVLLFEILLNATSLFNHGNVRLPPAIEGLLRLFVVTPEMHRVHHSAQPQETNSNFGFNLPWWDYLFGTYRSQPAAGHEKMTIGLSYFRDARQVERLPGMLLLPFARQPQEKDPSRPSEEETLAAHS